MYHPVSFYEYALYHALQNKTEYITFELLQISSTGLNQRDENPYLALILIIIEYTLYVNLQNGWYVLVRN